jgi:hypothetical protein
MFQDIINSCQSHNCYNCLVLWWFHLQIKIPVENWFGNIIQSFITSYSQETLFKVITDLDGFWNFFFWSHEKHDNEHANMAILMLSLKRFEPCFVSDVTSLSAMLVFSLTIHVLWQSHTSFFCTETGTYFVLMESMKDFRHLYFLCPLCLLWNSETPNLQVLQLHDLQFMSSYFRGVWILVEHYHPRDYDHIWISSNYFFHVDFVLNLVWASCNHADSQVTHQALMKSVG